MDVSRDSVTLLLLSDDHASQKLEVVGVDGLRGHDLKHIGPSILLARGIEDNIVRKITGHRSRELWRYQHLVPQLRKATANIVAGEVLNTGE